MAASKPNHGTTSPKRKRGNQPISLLACAEISPASPILAIHSGALGDVVIFARLLEQLGGPVTLMAGGEKGRLLEGLGVVARSIDFDSLPMHELFCDTPASQCELPRLLGRYERIVSCFGSGDARAENRLTEFCQAGRADFLPIRPAADWPSHLLSLWRQMLGVPQTIASENFPAWPVPASMHMAGQSLMCALGKAFRSGIPARLGCTPAWNAASDRARPTESGDDYFVIHPGAGSPSKCWPLERFVELAGLVKNRAKIARVVFVAGPAEADWWGPDKLDSLSRDFPLFVAPPLAQLAGLLAGASLYIGNDSGVSHLAAAVGAPTVAIFGPTSGTHFAPLGPKVKVLQKPRLEQIDVHEVVQIADNLF